jgi:hypothetical protein
MAAHRRKAWTEPGLQAVWTIASTSFHKLIHKLGAGLAAPAGKLWHSKPRFAQPIDSAGILSAKSLSKHIKSFDAHTVPCYPMVSHARQVIPGGDGGIGNQARGA